MDNYSWDGVTALRWFGIQGAAASGRSYKLGCKGCILAHPRKQLEKLLCSMLCPPDGQFAKIRIEKLVD
ncbi:MAG: hypothetical protein VYA34_03670 [Myxococcota bacterium]|nr:hypothetical protein [Myxococcota bacterium]